MRVRRHEETVAVIQSKQYKGMKYCFIRIKTFPPFLNPFTGTLNKVLADCFPFTEQVKPDKYKRDKLMQNNT